jgi:CBS domain-containing protein
MRNVTSPEERSRGERFLAAYARIEQVLQRRVETSRGKESFRRLVDIASKREAVVRRFQNDLSEFAELRNAIVHERISPDYLIAVPLPETVESIEKIADLITDPPRVYPRFAGKVVKFQVTDPLGDVLSVIDETGYSQFPVYSDGVYSGLLTDGAVARFLSAAALGKSRLGNETTVGEAMSYEKNIWRARFIARYASVFDAEELFKSSNNGRWRVSALLITENGDPQQALLGIITPYDILAWDEFA